MRRKLGYGNAEIILKYRLSLTISICGTLGKNQFVLKERLHGLRSKHILRGRYAHKGERSEPSGVYGESMFLLPSSLSVQTRSNVALETCSTESK